MLIEVPVLAELLSVEPDVLLSVVVFMSVPLLPFPEQAVIASAIDRVVNAVISFLVLIIKISL